MSGPGPCFLLRHSGPLPPARGQGRRPGGGESGGHGAGYGGAAAVALAAGTATSAGVRGVWGAGHVCTTIAYTTLFKFPVSEVVCGGGGGGGVMVASRHVFGSGPLTAG